MPSKVIQSLISEEQTGFIKERNASDKNDEKKGWESCLLHIQEVAETHRNP